MIRPFRFGVMCFTAPSRSAWRDLARKAEALGYATFIMADHFLNPFAQFLASWPQPKPPPPSV